MTTLRNTHKLMMGVSVLACLVVSAPAFAKAPTGDFAEFSACPRFTVGVNLCVVSHIEGGEVKIGGLAVSINRPILLQGGIIKQVTSPFVETFVNALGGQTLSATQLPVPGGLLGIVDMETLPRQVREIYREGAAGTLAAVTVTPQLVGLPTTDKRNLLAEEGTGLSLPVRFKLNNPLLGSECYIGSPASPVTLELTTGVTEPPPPNKPIRGSFGELFLKDGLEFAWTTATRLVDNSFSVPRAGGCGGGLSTLIDSTIDSKIGLPMSRGQGTVIMNAPIREAGTIGVIASER